MRRFYKLELPIMLEYALVRRYTIYSNTVTQFWMNAFSDLLCFHFRKYILNSQVKSANIKARYHCKRCCLRTEHSGDDDWRLWGSCQIASPLDLANFYSESGFLSDRLSTTPLIRNNESEVLQWKNYLKIWFDGNIRSARKRLMRRYETVTERWSTEASRKDNLRTV